MIVLDTHVFLWYILDDPNLDPTLKPDLEHDPSSVRVPSICIWEAMLLAERGRIVIEDPKPGAILRKWLEQTGFGEAPLTNDIAILSRTLEFQHDDPADRFVASTAYALGAKLATSDARLRQLPWVTLAY
jgi:PIN domain nuclease of toxin-antitoxin system